MLLHRVDSPGHRVAQLGPILWCRYGVGITVATGVSQWDDQSGNANHLKQATAGSQPAKQADGSILFDGVNDFLKASAFTLNQPITAYLLMKQVTWTSNDYILDGNALASLGLQQKNTGASPQLCLNAGISAVTDSDLAVGSFGVVAVVLNAANSLISVNDGTAATGNPSTSNPGGITLGATGDGTSTFSNIQVKELIVFNAAHDAPTRSIINGYLARVGGL